MMYFTLTIVVATYYRYNDRFKIASTEKPTLYAAREKLCTGTQRTIQAAMTTLLSRTERLRPS